MRTKMKTLGDKIQRLKSMSMVHSMFYEEDVKKFIKELKDGIIEGYDCTCDLKFERLINKLAGPKLT